MRGPPGGLAHRKRKTLVRNTLPVDEGFSARIWDERRRESAGYKSVM
jgi:hypothetical protein